MKRNYEIEQGKAHPIGATVNSNGVNFSLFSENASGVELLLFNNHDDSKPFMSIELDPDKHRTFHFWHVFIKDLKAGVHYAYRVDGEENYTEGFRFNKNKVLLDPYGKGYTSTLWNRVDACNAEDNLKTSMRSVVIDPENYDWEDDKSPRFSMSNSIIYEMHVAGFTKNTNSKVKHPGTFKGVIEKIPYLQELGITAVELLPVFEFDEDEILRVTEDGNVLKNYWGYSTIGFFAPESAYCVNPEKGNHLDEFRDMVKALHKVGIEVILDVVYNHTNEGNHQGPCICFKGIDNKVYYHLVENDKQYYMDYTGCGNTVNCNHPIVEKFITDSLEFWVKDMHVDGFRFDEGSILSRGENGNPLPHPPVLWNIELMDTFAETKLIAEAWDAAGLYQIGTFPGYRWAEWNGKYRDCIRRFVKGDTGLINEVASRISGSADLYQPTGHTPVNSINLITCHDGFTMKDLVSYNYKHNEANGENSRDGIDDNDSWNCGVEGETSNKAIEKFRIKQMKNFATILLLSKGVPMILSGDEVGRTQRGNNNAYCQDNELNWFDWTLPETNKELFRYFKLMIKFRKNNNQLTNGNFFTGQLKNKQFKDIEWHGCKLNLPGFNDPNSRVLAFTIASTNKNENNIHVIINMEDGELDFEIPELMDGKSWKRFVDTALEYPNEIVEHGEEETIKNKSYSVNAHSIVILISES
jgi:glycogen operon protein